MPGESSNVGADVGGVDSQNFDENFVKLHLSTAELGDIANLERDSFLQSVRPSPLDSELLSASESDVEKGCMRGPFHSVHEVGSFLYPKGPIGPIVISRRFGVAQSDKIRPCDDAKRSHLNEAAFIDSKLSLSGVDDFLSLAAYVSETFPDQETVFFKRDHGAAYRQIPIAPDEIPKAVVVFCHPLSKKKIYYVHTALPFGAVASVHYYNRVSQAVTHIARKYLLIPMLSYFDDFFAPVPKDQAWECFRAFGTLNRILGFEIKEKKDVPPTVTGEILGHIITLGKLPFELHIKEERCMNLRDIAGTALATGSLSARRAAELAGKCNFALAAVYGRCGRAMAKPIYARAHMKSTSCRSDYKNPFQGNQLGKGLRLALLWIRDVLPLVPARTYMSRARRAQYIMYVDATGSGGLGAVLLNTNEVGNHQVYYTCQHFHADDLLGHLKQKVHVYETLAAWMGIRAFAHLMPEGGSCDIYCDNILQQTTLTKGYSRSSDCTNIAHTVWSWCALKKLDPWFVRVISKDNLADGPSRDRFEILNKMRAVFTPHKGDEILRAAIQGK